MLKCNGCVACCKNKPRVVVDELYGDDVNSFETTINHEGRTVLKHKENGDCIYLIDGGCGVHERKPYVCRTFNCMTFVKSTPPEQLEKEDKDVVEAGCQRIKDQTISDK